MPIKMKQSISKRSNLFLIFFDFYVIKFNAMVNYIFLRAILLSIIKKYMVPHDIQSVA